MATPVKNTCTPENIYGGFDHTLFLGCSVMSFSASGGWNEQVSEITVQLIEDTCEAPAAKPKHYWDLDLTEQTTTNADPGFFGLTYNIIGAPVYFRVGDFEFAGLLQSWEQSNSHSGNPTYTVKIVDPRQILEGTQLIINEYSGSVGAIYNLFNVYGYTESQGSACPTSPFTAGTYYQSSPGVYVSGDGAPDGAVFGSPAAAFGGADVNDNGMQWNQILAGTRILGSSYPIPGAITPWSPYGRVAFKAPSVYPATGMGIMPADSGSVAYFFIDLEEVPVAPSYWRLNGTSTGLMDAISQICQDSGADYYVELVPVIDATLGSGIHKFIKVRTADRVSSPALNHIDAFVNAAGREVSSYNKGRELRNEVTSSFVIGGPKQSVYQAEQNTDPEGDGDPTPPEKDDMIIPYFGVDPTTGDVIIPYLDVDNYWEFDAPTPDLALQLADARYNRAIAATITINEKEIIAASAGFDTWMSYASSVDTSLWQAIDVELSGAWDLKHVEQLVKDLNGRVTTDQFRPADLVASRKGTFKAHDDNNLDFEVCQIAFAWIEKFAKEYYGKKYQVRVPFTCGRSDSESGQILTSEQPSDGGWTEVTPVIGLAHPSLYTDFFTLDDNRLGSFCRFDNSDGLELSNLGVNDFVSTSGKAWIKIETNPEYVYVDESTLFSPRVVITLPQEILSLEELPDDIQRSWAGFINVIRGMKGLKAHENKFKTRLAQAQKKLGSVLTHLAGSQKAVMPDAAAFGIQSNVLKYGPWGSAGPAGAVSVINDEGLVPWEYGGFTTLDLAGDSIADAGVTNTQVTEEGSVTVAGYPDIPLGAELRASDTGGPFNGGTGNNLVENRSASSGSHWGTNYYYTTVYPWDGTFGPNVTSITTQVGESGINTTYNLRTWTPKFGLFFKNNAERLKRVGRQRLQSQKQIRAWSLQRIKRNQLAFLDKIAGDRPGVKMEGVFGPTKSPHEVFIGQLIPWNNSDYKRPLSATSSCLELPVELAEEYGSKAFMSLDGLLRPVSVNGSGGLPPYAAYLEQGCQVTANRGTQPPVDKVKGDVGKLLQYNVPHTQPYFDPFSNPNSDVTDLSDTPDIGHDIEMVGRGTGIPGSSMIMPIEGYANSSDTADSDYYSDYRMLALRGPLLMQSWSYDLDGFPIPNKVDTPANARSGVFDSTNLQCKFMDDWLRQTDTWPVAPIDLRYDRDRGVWTVPQYRDIVAKLECCINPYGSGVATQVSGPTMYDCDGVEILEPWVVVEDGVGHPCLQSGDNVIARFDPVECTYKIIEHKTSNKGDDIFKFRLLECVCGGDSTGFGHRPEGWGKAMRMKWNPATESWEDAYQVKMWPGLGCNEDIIGVSGLCGWAKIVQDLSPEIDGNCHPTGDSEPCIITCDPESEEYQEYHHPSGSGYGAQIITMERIAEYIQFTTFENVGCSTDTCFPATYRSEGAGADVNGFWNGKSPTAVCGSGAVMVYFGDNYKKWSDCLRGFNDCGGDLFTWQGMAVLDTKATSDALCTSPGSCVDEEDCCKFIYRAIDVDVPVRAVDTCCTGDYSSLTNLDLGSPFYEIVTRTGITARPNPSSDCQMIFDSSLKIIDHNECYPPSGWDRAPLNTVLPFEGLAFGAGLWLTKATESGAGLSLASCPEGINDECAYHIQAGFRPLNNSGTCTKDTGQVSPPTLTDDGTRFINVVDFQGGFRAYDGPNKCDLLLRGGNKWTWNHSKCIEDPTYVDPDSTEIYHEVEFIRGIKVKDDDEDDCKIVVGAGTNFYMSAGCVPATGAPTSNELKSKFFLKDGFSARDVAGDPCAVDIGAGIYFSTDSVCSSGSPDSSRLKNTVKLGPGLWANDTADNCEVSLTAGILMSANNTECVKGDGTSGTGGKPITQIDLHKGLWGQRYASPNECVWKMSAGFELGGGNDVCVSGSDTKNEPHNKLIAAKGLEIQQKSDCTAEIGLYFDFGGVKAAQVTVGDCLEVEDAGSCVANLKFKEKYGDGTTHVTQNVITGLTVQCCTGDGNAGVRQVDFTTTDLHFNSCGQLVDITSGSSGSGECPC